MAVTFVLTFVENLFQGSRGRQAEVRVQREGTLALHDAGKSLFSENFSFFTNLTIKLLLLNQFNIGFFTFLTSTIVFVLPNRKLKILKLVLKI